MGDITISGAAVVALGAMLSALGGAIVVIFKLLMASKDAQYKEAMATRDARIVELIHESDAIRGIAKNMTTAAEVGMNQLRVERGQEPLPKLAPVVPEHRSPVTPEQAAAAELATLRARAAVVTAELGLPPRTATTVEEKTHVTEEQKIVEKAEDVAVRAKEVAEKIKDAADAKEEDARKLTEDQLDGKWHDLDEKKPANP